MMSKPIQKSSFLLVFAGITVTAIAYLVFGHHRVASAFNDGATIFFVIYMSIIMICLLILLGYLKHSTLFLAILTGASVGYFDGIISYFIMEILMTDGLTRLINSFSMTGWTGILIILWIPIALQCWIWSAIGFLIVSGISKRDL